LEAEKIEQLRARLARGKKIKTDELVKLFAERRRPARRDAAVPCRRQLRTR
jgi:hypothetical protein